MAAKKMETGNPIAVAVLLVILVGAIAATFIRISRPSGVAAAPPESAVVGTSESRPSGAMPVFRPAYNPFKKPVGFDSGDTNGPMGPTIPKLQGVEYGGKLMPLMPLNEVRMQPLHQVAPKLVATSSNQPSQDPPVPKFTLLTTVRSGDRVCAVIQVGDSGSRTVGVGDVLEAGFVVEALTTEYAILTDGRQTVRIDKPHPQEAGRQ